MSETTATSVSTESKQQDKRPDFTGTWLAVIPLNGLSEHIQHIQNTYIPTDALIRDNVIKRNTERSEEEGYTRADSLETDTHITVHFGIREPTPDVIEQLQKFGPFVVTVQDVGRFTNPPKMIENKEHSWDVLWCDVVSDKESALFKLHTLIGTAYDKIWHHPGGYKPHVTIGYTKFGRADGIIESIEENSDHRKFGPFEILVDTIIFKKYQDKSPNSSREISLCPNFMC